MLRRLTPSVFVIFALSWSRAFAESDEPRLIASKLAFLGHPIHPMMVVFPLGLFVAALVFDAVGIGWRNTLWYRVSYYTMIVGFIGGLVAAATGLVEYLLIIPERGDVKTTAIRHGILMAAAMGLFAVSLWLRWKRPEQPKCGIRFAATLTLIGVIVMLAGGWFGGHLVFREGVGIHLESQTPASEHR